MGKELLYGVMGNSIKGNGKMELKRDKESVFGLMEIITRENSRKIK
jgi:hypothetical protein